MPIVASVQTLRTSSTPRVLFLGPLPLPIGGVSIHLSRLTAWMKRNGMCFMVMDESRHRKDGIPNIRSLHLITYVRRLGVCNVSHIHSSIPMLRAIHVVLSKLFGLRVIVTIHSWRSGQFVTLLTRQLLKLSDEVILVNEEINRSLRLKKYRVLPAFLPPLPDSGQVLPACVEEFVEKAQEKGRYLICANAYRLFEYKGVDQYGLDLCVRLLHEMVNQRGIDVSLVFIVASDGSESALFRNAREKIKNLGLQESFLLYDGPVDFVTLMERCDLVLRPTCSDGDALTIREALYLKVPVIASDVTKRPAGTILFRSRNVDDLLERSIWALNRGRKGKAKQTHCLDVDRYYFEYSRMYRKALTACG